MERYAAFLRGINVGRHIVKMDTLRQVFEALGFGAVSTFIASGNVFFSTADAPEDLERRIEAALQAALGYEVATFVRTAGEVTAAAAYPAFADVERTAEDSLYVVFMDSAPDDEHRARITQHASTRDLLELAGRELYWLTRGSLLDTTLSYTDWTRLLGNVTTTVRNANTVQRMAAKLAAMDQTPAAGRRPAGRSSRRSSAAADTTSH